MALPAGACRKRGVVDLFEELRIRRRMRGVTAYAVHDARLDEEVGFPELPRFEVVALPA